MAILVTGGAGYIGSHMVHTLLDQDEEVLVVDNLATGFEWAVPRSATFVNGDVGDRALMQFLIETNDVDSIIHFAGSAEVPESLKNPIKYYGNNTTASLALMDVAASCGVQNFIFSSTAAVYGIPDDGPVTEEQVPRPETPYGASKLMTEQMLRDVSSAHGLKHGILRYFNVAGADPKGRTGQSTKGATHLIKVACEAALGKRSHLSVFGTDFETKDGTGVRDFIHVSDLTWAHYLLLQQLRHDLDSVTANCGYGQGYSVLDVIRTVKALSGGDFEVRYERRRDGDVGEVVASNKKLMDLIDWVPAHKDLADIIETALSWEAKLDRLQKGAA
ncbi:MAG: UDP-glucose 4-epimerase GalE [Pseudomonadota bacterium]